MGLMTTMRERMKIVLWALLFLFILSMSIGGLVGGANIIDLLAGKVDPNRVIARINGKDISPDYFNNLVNQQINQAKSSGQQINEQQYERARNTAWDNLVQEVLVSMEIERMGLTATDDEVLYHLRENPPQFLQNNPSFQTDGNFDPEKYFTALASPQGDEWAPIENWMRSSYIPNFKLTQYLNQSFVVTDDDILKEFIKKNTKYTVDAIHITFDKVPKDKAEPSETELIAEYKASLSDFEHDQLRNVSFVSWKKVASSEDSLNNTVLVKDIISRTQSGESFAELASEYSKDPGSQQNGGDVGWFGKGQMVKPFEEAAFNAAKGQIIGPVDSRFGSHIINIRDKKTENGKEQVLASHILLKTEASPTTLSNLRRSATLFSYDAQDSGFAAAAKGHGLTIQAQKKLDRSSSRVRGLGSLRSGVRFTFNNPLGSVSDVLENDQHYIVFHIDSVISAGFTDFTDVKNQLANKVKREKQKSISRDMIDELVIDLNASDKPLQELMEVQKRFDNIKDESKTISEGFTSIGRGNFISGALLNASTNDLIGPVETSRGWALLQIKNISAIDSTEYEVQKDALKTSMVTRNQSQTLQAWLDNLKNSAEIIDNRNYFY